MANIMKFGGCSGSSGSSGSPITIPVIGTDFNWTGGDNTYLVLNDDGGNWRIKFLTSGVFTPLKDMTIDAFLVGGGGGGADSSSFGSGNAGGAGGYTKTEKQITLTKDTEYSIVIGSGGLGNNYYQSRSTKGGDTSAFGVTAAGGNSKIPNTNYWYGVDGGSGSGALNAVGGSDGGNGGSYGSYTGGTGQGTTTREFGESTGDLYAGGGAGSPKTSGMVISGGEGGGGSGTYYKENTELRDGAENTGGGGGGVYTPGAPDSARYGGNGGSGIVIIRNFRS